ncbi:MAG: SDR family oxidoreductase [Alphaproteobacteria bacterium]|nr:SDR family oxidoreductase [Alphaproteobacteria bacterium]MBU0796331.1 SDR family oxidoreductase [Alphaproteobacteria bacterium]MBU0889152.1 SDR family oxidoreductase [Alphaproteobacteria bacterium]MBU1812186.1 SDR family oxidoreductase [Alphaproteobacteria bacterium]
MRSHEGRVVLVSGAARGIGFAIAQGFAGAGAAVAILDLAEDAVIHAAGQIAAEGGTAFGIAGDVGDFAAMRAVVTEIEGALGPVDILVNNAGISPKHEGRRHEIWEMEPEEWRQVMEVNLTGCFNLARLVTPGMKQRGQGSIVNMASVAGKAYCDFVGVHYSTTKAGLIGFTRHLAGELGPYGITVNAIAPGRIDTPLMRGVASAVNDAIVEATPLRRLGQPQDVASAALFLTSAAAGFVTGQTLDVAGGWLMS